MQHIKNYPAWIFTNDLGYINAWVESLVNSVSWMMLLQRYDYSTCLLILKYILGWTPNYLCDGMKVFHLKIMKVTHSQVTAQQVLRKGPSTWAMASQTLNAFPSKKQQSLSGEMLSSNDLSMLIWFTFHTSCKGMIHDSLMNLTKWTNDSKAKKL